MWLPRSTWASLLTQNARLMAEAQAWEEIRESLKAERIRLRDEMQRLKDEIQRERERADKAVDELLALRGIGPVSPPPKPEAPEDASRMFEEDENELSALKKRLENEGAVAVIREQDGDGHA